MSDYSAIDRSPLVGFLFYPRKDITECPAGAFDLAVPVDPGIDIVCRFYMRNKDWPSILYFHGNGEVVSDYDGIAPFYHRAKINLVVADYRGYGASGGAPNFTNLLKDGRRVFASVRKELARRSLRQDLRIMGRSLGSLCALDLAHPYGENIRGLIIESGFAGVTRLIRCLNLPTGGLNLEPLEEERMSMIRRIAVPALIIHGESDTLIPVQEARHLYSALGVEKKKLVIIPGADHNNILFAGLDQYFLELQQFMAETA